MSREIKFRAWSNYSNQFEYGDLNLNPIHYECHVLINGVVSHSVKRDTVGQYIGLKDKNGTDIYEGDIIKHKDYKGYSSEKWEVIFYSGAFFMAGLPNKIRIYNLGDRLDAIEIIGNVHENPELLNND